MIEIKLNLINNSNDSNNSSIVIFQKNQEAPLDLPIAWRVINDLGQGQQYPFDYPMALTVTTSDRYMNFTPMLAASYGQQFLVVSDESGDILRSAGSSSSPDVIEVCNDRKEGIINALIYSDKRLLAVKQNIEPAAKAMFRFLPTLWFGVMSPMESGNVIANDSLSNVAEISLLGIASADIVMTGGGTSPYEFTLENIRFA